MFTSARIRLPAADAAAGERHHPSGRLEAVIQLKAEVSTHELLGEEEVAGGEALNQVEWAEIPIVEHQHLVEQRGARPPVAEDEERIGGVGRSRQLAAAEAGLGEGLGNGERS